MLIYVDIYIYTLIYVDIVDIIYIYIYICVCAPRQTSFIAWIFIPKNGTDDHVYFIHIYITGGFYK